jgi:hypothetical protein
MSPPPEQPLNRAVDPAKWAFDIGAYLLGLYGEAPRPARAIVARWLKQAPARKLIEILIRAGEAERGDLRGYVEAALKPEAPAPAAAPLSPDETLRLRVPALRSAGMLHLLSPDQHRAARRLGLLADGE